MKISFERLKAIDPHDFSNGPRGYDSVMGLGKGIPDSNGTIKFDNIYVPAGTTIKHPTMSDRILVHPYYNEYIVFDPTRILIKFIVQIQWK